MSADNTWNLLDSTSGIISIAILGDGGPAPLLSDVTVFVNYNSRGTICHRMTHKNDTQAVPVRSIPCIDQWLSRPGFASHNSLLGNTQNCSCSIMMTNKDAMSKTACKKHTIFSNCTEPNCLSILCRGIPPSWSCSSQFIRFSVFPFLILFMT